MHEESHDPKPRGIDFEGVFDDVAIFLDEWVYNDADIDEAKKRLGKRLEIEQNQRLV